MHFSTGKKQVDLKILIMAHRCQICKKKNVLEKKSSIGESYSGQLKETHYTPKIRANLASLTYSYASSYTPKIRANLASLAYSYASSDTPKIRANLASLAYATTKYKTEVILAVPVLFDLKHIVWKLQIFNIESFYVYKPHSVSDIEDLLSIVPAVHPHSGVVVVAL